MKYSVSIALVLNELVTNSYKHAFSGRTSGNIYVRIKKKPDDIEIALSDDGTGIPGNINPDTTNSIGLMLVKALIDQMNGNIKLSSGNGTTFRITLPINISLLNPEADLSSS
jgi:two-component sensor histidine kinase